MTMVLFSSRTVCFRCSSEIIGIATILSPIFCKLLRHFELRHKLPQQIRRKRAEAVIRQTRDEEGTGNNIIDFTAVIPQSTVERQAVQLAFFIADNGNRLRKGIDGLNTPANFML